MLTKRQTDELLGILSSPVTPFDCGTLCAPGNGGVPVCCHAESIVPVLYKAELAVLQKRSRLWRKYVPRTAQQKELVRDTRPCDVFAVCKGAEHCERDNRSIACRTFPFEPYLDHAGELAGLVYNYEFKGTCPLIGSRHLILPEFIDQSLRLWERTFEFSEEERQFYLGHSQSLRRSFAQRGKRIPVFTRAGLRRLPTARPGRRTPPPPSRAAAAPSASRRERRRAGTGRSSR